MDQLVRIRRTHCDTCEALIYVQNRQGLEIERLASGMGEKTLSSDSAGKNPASDGLATVDSHPMDSLQLTVPSFCFLH
jgi:hypothetical protein